jgi:hypothetical protein
LPPRFSPLPITPLHSSHYRLSYHFSRHVFACLMRRYATPPIFPLRRSPLPMPPFCHFSVTEIFRRFRPRHASLSRRRHAMPPAVITPHELCHAAFAHYAVNIRSPFSPGAGLSMPPFFFAFDAAPSYFASHFIIIFAAACCHADTPSHAITPHISYHFAAIFAGLFSLLLAFLLHFIIDIFFFRLRHQYCLRQYHTLPPFSSTMFLNAFHTRPSFHYAANTTLAYHCQVTLH